MVRTNPLRSYAALAFLTALVAGCADVSTAPVTTPPAVASVNVAPADLALQVGATAAVAAVPQDSNGTQLPGYTITWVSSDLAVATVSSSGMVSARGAGTATIRASAAGKSGSVQVTVSVPPVVDREVAWIVVTPAGGMIPQDPGTSRQLGVVARALDGTEIVGRPITWSSSNPAVATVSASGLLEAHASGTSWVTAVVDGRRDSTNVWVRSLITRIETDPSELALGVGDSHTIVARALDENGAPLTRTYTWSTSNSAVARVDSTGRVAATGAGTALITVSAEARHATVLVTVTGQQWRLTRAGDAPLPATLYTTTMMVNGVVREAVVQVTGGTLRMRDGRYELRLHGWAIAEGAAPVATTLSSDGVFAYDVVSGGPMFHESDEWTDREPRFRGRFLPDGRMEIGWNPAPNAPLVPLVFEQ